MSERIPSRQVRTDNTVVLEVRDSAIFTNYLRLKRRMTAIPADVKRVIIDFENAWVVDHTVLEKLHRISTNWTDRQLILEGFDDHVATSSHQLAARRKRRMVAA